MPTPWTAQLAVSLSIPVARHRATMGSQFGRCNSLQTTDDRLAKASKIIDTAHRRRVGHQRLIGGDEHGTLTLGLGQQQAVEGVGV